MKWRLEKHVRAHESRRLERHRDQEYFNQEGEAREQTGDERGSLELQAGAETVKVDERLR